MHQEGRGPGTGQSGHQFRGTVAGDERRQQVQRGADHAEHQDEQCPFLPGAGRSHFLHRQFALHAGQGVQGLYLQHLQACQEEALCGMVLCRCQRGDSPGSEALLQALRFRGRFGHQPDEGFHGREAEPGDDAQSHHRQGPLHRGQCEPLLLSHHRLRLEARLHLGNTQLQREGRDSKSCHQSMEQRICGIEFYYSACWA